MNLSNTLSSLVEVSHHIYTNLTDRIHVNEDSVDSLFKGQLELKASHQYAVRILSMANAELYTLFIFTDIIEQFHTGLAALLDGHLNQDIIAYNHIMRVRDEINNNLKKNLTGLKIERLPSSVFYKDTKYNIWSDGDQLLINILFL